MSLIEINQSTCNQDGICAETCPIKIIAFNRGEYPSLIDGGEEACIRCGHCVAVCPTGSLTHRDIPVEQCPPVQENLLLSPEHCEHFLRSRRSIRTYRDKSVPQDLIQKLIEVARYAPSGHNSQDAEWLVLGNKERIHSLGQLVIDWMHWAVENNTKEAEALHLDNVIARWDAGVDIILRGAPIVIVAHAQKDNRRAITSCALALSYLELAATSMGLGTCWAGYFGLAATIYKPLMDALPLPDGHRCFGAMMVGYPKFKYHRLPLRNTPKITWHV